MRNRTRTSYIKTGTLMISACAVLSYCSPVAEDFYSLEDFAKVEKFDSHVHINTDRDVFYAQAREDNFTLLSIVVDVSRGMEHIRTNFGYQLRQSQKHPGEIFVATAFDIGALEGENWPNSTLSWLDSCFEQGAIAMKIWKNIGMVHRDTSGQLVMIDDPRFDVLLGALTEREIPVIGHLGEPQNCWLPLDQMTTKNDSSYFANHPEYYMFLQPELPSYEDQIAARDRMLDKNPDLNFVGAHMGSLEWSVDVLAATLDKYPTIGVDLAARMGQVFYQTKMDRKKVREFFIRYQDRILYATDLGDNGTGDAESLQRRMHETWLRDWRFFVTDDEMQSDLIDGRFQGLKLPRGVVDKIFKGNSVRYLVAAE